MRRFLTTLAAISLIALPVLAQTLAPFDIPQINLASTARGGVTGVLPQANGGSGVNTSTATNGQLLIGRTSDHSLNLAALTAGSNVTITNGASAITVAAANTFVPSVSQPTATTVAAAVDNAYLCNTTTNAIIVTLPTAVGVAGHQIVVFCQIFGSTHNVTLATTSSQTINGSAPAQTLTAANKSFTVMSDGANWVILSST